MTDPSTTTLALLALAGLAAGFVDAVVGGGGLVQLPALLIGLPHASPVQILGTFGPLMVCAFAGSVGGAFIGSHISDSAFDPIILVVLIVVGAYVLFRPRLGESTQLRHTGRRHLGIAMVSGFVIGVYDGALGPGTGSFLVISLVSFLGYNFLEASAKARLANWATNLAALCVFVPQGAVLWKVGFVMGVCNLAGGYLGARTAVARGTRFVRIFFIIVVTGFVIRIGGGLLGLW
jgi:uncharacterized membrane protein YfcA